MSSNITEPQSLRCTCHLECPKPRRPWTSCISVQSLTISAYRLLMQSSSTYFILASSWLRARTSLLPACWRRRCSMCGISASSLVAWAGLRKGANLRTGTMASSKWRTCCKVAESCKVSTGRASDGLVSVCRKRRLACATWAGQAGMRRVSRNHTRCNVAEGPARPCYCT